MFVTKSSLSCNCFNSRELLPNIHLIDEYAVQEMKVKVARLLVLEEGVGHPDLVGVGHGEVLDLAIVTRVG